MMQMPTMSIAQWRADLQVLVDELTAHHLHLFHTITQEQFLAAVADLHDAMPTLPAAKIVVLNQRGKPTGQAMIW